MTITEYLDACKQKLEISSTYRLAQIMGVDERRLREHYSGVGTSEFVYFKIAQILELDPAYVIADIKSQTEKDEVKREFFKSFVGMSKAKNLIVILAVCISSLFTTQESGFNDHRRVFRRWWYFA